MPLLLAGDGGGKDPLDAGGIGKADQIVARLRLAVDSRQKGASGAQITLKPGFKLVVARFLSGSQRLPLPLLPAVDGG